VTTPHRVRAAVHESRRSPDSKLVTKSCTSEPLARLGVDARKGPPPAVSWRASRRPVSGGDLVDERRALEKGCHPPAFGRTRERSRAAGAAQRRIPWRRERGCVAPSQCHGIPRFARDDTSFPHLRVHQLSHRPKSGGALLAVTVTFMVRGEADLKEVASFASVSTSRTEGGVRDCRRPHSSK
jgi:hypothetical protein